jgi:hypothetical protein
VAEAGAGVAHDLAKAAGERDLLPRAYLLVAEQQDGAVDPGLVDTFERRCGYMFIHVNPTHFGADGLGDRYQFEHSPASREGMVLVSRFIFIR